MKFRMTLKDPNSYDHYWEEAAIRSLDNTALILDEDEREELIDIRKEKIKKFLSQWFLCSEYITIEFDTETNTAVIQKA